MGDYSMVKIKDAMRDFIEAFYNEGAAKHELAACRNRHEGYGLLADSYVSLCGAMDSVKAGMKDCLKTLPSDDQAFYSAADATYSALIELAIVCAQMSMQDMNIINQMMDHIQSAPLPLEEYLEDMNSEDDSESVPDVDDD